MSGVQHVCPRQSTSYYLPVCAPQTSDETAARGHRLNQYCHQAHHPDSASRLSHPGAPHRLHMAHRARRSTRRSASHDYGTSLMTLKLMTCTPLVRPWICPPIFPSTQRQQSFYLFLSPVSRLLLMWSECLLVTRLDDNRQIAFKCLVVWKSLSMTGWNKVEKSFLV